MPTDQAVANKAAFIHFHDAVNSRDEQVIAKMIDEFVDPDVVFHAPAVAGTHLGEYRGAPATGKPVRYNEIFTLRFADGRIAEVWGVVDVYAQLRQLGMIPA